MEREGSRGTGRGIGAAARLLRRPVLIVGEVVAIGVVGALAVAIPQAPDEGSVRAFADRWPILGRVTALLGLHDLTTSGWFLALVLLSLASLLVVQVDQWRRVRRLWGQRPDLRSMARAPFRRTAPAAACRKVPPAPEVEVAGRLGLLGSPLFHVGLVVVLVAGLLRLLFFSEADARLVVGETLAAAQDGWLGQRRGPLARPFSLREPVRLDGLSPDWYPSGSLRGLSATLSLASEPASPRTLAINAPLDVGRERLYLSSQWGAAVILEHRAPGASVYRVAYLGMGDESARGSVDIAGGREARLKVRVGPEGAERVVEVRLVRDGALLQVTAISQGEEMVLGPEESLVFADLQYWAQLRGSRDPSRPLFFLGIAVAIAGALLMFAVVRVETAVFVEGGTLVVALRAQRFAPLFSERFEALCTEWIG